MDLDDEPCRSARLQKPRRSPRINNTSWIQDDLDDLRFYTYADDRVYQCEDKSHIVSIDSNEDKLDKSINMSTNTSVSRNKKVHFQNTTKANKIKAVAAMIFGSMMSSFNTSINNSVIKPVGDTKEI